MAMAVVRFSDALLFVYSDMKNSNDASGLATKARFSIMFAAR